MSDSNLVESSPLSATIESRPSLLRALGPGMAIAMVVGNVIGSGIFAKPGGIAADAGQFPMIISAWITGGCVCICGALCFAELAVMLPRAGGLYVYLREAYGRPVAFLFGWSEFLFGRPASIGALSYLFIDAFSRAIGIHFSSLANILLSIVLIVGMAWVNIIGVIWGGRVQALTTLIKASFLGLLAILPFAMTATGHTGAEMSNFQSTIAPLKPTFSTQFAAIMLAVMWAYNGWHGITPVAEEVRNPQRNIPIALFGGLGILIVLYVSANFAYHSVLSMSELADSGKDAAQAMVEKLLSPQGESIAQAGVAMMSAVIMCSVFGAINSNMLNGPRVSFAMGRDDVFFRPLGRVHVNYRTPASAIIVQAVMSILLVLASAMLVEFFESFRNRDIFGMLTDYVVFSASFFYMLAVIAVFVLRRKHPEWERPYRTLGYPVVPILYLTFYTWFVFHIYEGNPREAMIGVGLTALGLPFYYCWRYWAVRNPDTLHDGM